MHNDLDKDLAKRTSAWVATLADMLVDENGRALGHQDYVARPLIESLGSFLAAVAEDVGEAGTTEELLAKLAASINGLVHNVADDLGIQLEHTGDPVAEWAVAVDETAHAEPRHVADDGRGYDAPAQGIELVDDTGSRLTVSPMEASGDSGFVCTRKEFTSRAEPCGAGGSSACARCGRDYERHT